MKGLLRLVILGVSIMASANPVWAGDQQALELTMIAQHAAQGDAGAQLLYGLAYLEGRYQLKPDPQKAVYWLQRAARAEQPYAQLMMGNLYAEGKGVDREPAHAVYWWKKSALAGNPESQFNLGKACLDGQGVGKDATQAVHWLIKSAEQGNNDAKYLLGKMYYEGYSVPEDKALGKDWLAQAAAQGHSAAINLLGVAEDIAEYTTMVYQQSAEVLQEKAAGGDAQAEYELGLRYESGAWDVTRDDKQALHWLSKAAADGNRHAMATLSHVYERGLLGVPADPAQAAAWLTKSRAEPPWQPSTNGGH
jgi:TPR repeat protein